MLGERPNHLERTRDDIEVTAADLLSVRRISGPPTHEGIRSNIAVALRYFDAWLRGSGAVALYGLMEDAATAEIARCQVWQRLRHGAVTRESVIKIPDDETAALGKEDPAALTAEARGIFATTALSPHLPAFFTTDAYARHLVRRGTEQS